MAKKRNGGGLFAKIYIGKEKDEDFARSTLPTGRMQLFFDVFKNSFGKLFFTNILVLITFIPLLLAVMYHTARVGAIANNYPFSANIGIGYPSVSSFTGFAEQINLNATVSILSWALPLASLIAGLGLSGGMYIIRNLLWGEGVFVASDFFRGIKKNFFSVAGASLVFGIFIFLIIFGINAIDYALAIGMGVKGLLIVAKSVLIVLTAIGAIMFMFECALGVTYKLKFHQLLKNSLILTFALLIRNVIFAVVALIPVAIYALNSVSSIFGILCFLIMITIGFSYIMLVWSDYAQGVFDIVINPQIGAKTKRGMYEKQASDTATLDKYKKTVKERSLYERRPIKPLEDEGGLTLSELPETFTLKDLEALQESKQKIYDEQAAYEKEHENDERYKLTEEEIKQEEAKRKELEKVKKTLEKHNHVQAPLFNVKNKKGKK